MGAICHPEPALLPTHPHRMTGKKRVTKGQEQELVIVVGFKTHMGYGLGKPGYGYGLYFVNPPCTHTHS